MANETNGKAVMTCGRIVWTSGDLFKGKQKVDDNTRQPIFAQDGKPVMGYGFGLAIPKSAFGPGGAGEALWNAMYEQAYEIYPSRQLPPDFAFKYKDGDGVDHNGQPFAQRAGHAGHLVFAMTTRLPIKFFRFESTGNVLVNDGIKNGDFVNVQVMVKAHAAVGRGKPGLYLNPMAVQFLGFGEAIINTPSGDQIFGNQAPPLPPGASATPIAPAGMLVPTGAPPSFAGAPQVPAYGAPPVAPQAPAAAPTQPHYGVLPQQFQQPPTAPQPAPSMSQAPAYGAPPAYPPQASAPAAAPGYPAAPPSYPAPAAPAAYPGTQAPTGYPPVAAPMGAYPGSPMSPPSFPGAPR
jgi:hypothetical protein